MNRIMLKLLAHLCLHMPIFSVSFQVYRIIPVGNPTSMARKATLFDFFTQHAVVICGACGKVC